MWYFVTEGGRTVLRERYRLTSPTWIRLRESNTRRIIIIIVCVCYFLVVVTRRNLQKREFVYSPLVPETRHHPGGVEASGGRLDVSRKLSRHIFNSKHQAETGLEVGDTVRCSSPPAPGAVFPQHFQTSQTAPTNWATWEPRSGS